MDGVLICKECGASAERRSPTQRYCPSCSDKRDLMRKRRWAQAHPCTKEQVRRIVQYHAARRECARQAGQVINREKADSISWNAQDDPPLLWLARVAVPFSYAVSKNHIYSLRAAGHVALRREARDARRAIALLVRGGWQGGASCTTRFGSTSSSRNRTTGVMQSMSSIWCAMP